MTISVTPNPAASPPSCTVTVSVTTGHVMSAVAVYRNDHNGRTLLRTQPTAGFDSRTVTDYECPYEENVTYDWTATSSDPASATTLFSEAWASTAAWTTDSGTWNVSGGKLRNTTTSIVSLSRTFASGKYRYSFASWVAPSGSLNAIYIYTGLPTSGIALRMSGTTLTIGNSTTTVATAIDATQPFVVDFNASSVTVSGTGGSATVTGSYSASKLTFYSSGASANSYQVGAMSVKSYAASSNTAQTSSVVSLNPDDAWLIHPGSASLSVPMSNTDPMVAGIRSFGDVSNESNATVHRILGSATPIPTTTGPRADDTTSLIVYTATSDERVALRALLAPDVPLLINVPPSWNTDFNMGFYQVGETRERRDWPWITESVRDRYFDLPLTRVQSPVVDVENTGWSYASVAAEFALYTDLTTYFATYADLASNTRV